MLCTCMSKVQAAAYIALDKNLPEYSQGKKIQLRWSHCAPFLLNPSPVDNTLSPPTVLHVMILTTSCFHLKLFSLLSVITPCLPQRAIVQVQLPCSPAYVTSVIRVPVWCLTDSTSWGWLPRSKLPLLGWEKKKHGSVWRLWFDNRPRETKKLCCFQLFFSFCLLFFLFPWSLLL